MARVVIFALVLGLARASESEDSCMLQKAVGKGGAGKVVRGEANAQSKVVQESNSGPVYKWTTITFTDDDFKEKMYKDICPKAASYMAECSRREVAGNCEEYMKFDSAAQFNMYISEDYGWLSQALLDGFHAGATFDGYADLSATEYADKKAGATVIEAACGGDFPYPKPDDNNICYRDKGWAWYLRLGYWGKDNCVCGDQICEKEDGAAMDATQEPWRSAWEDNCEVTQCPV